MQSRQAAPGQTKTLFKDFALCTSEWSCWNCQERADIFQNVFVTPDFLSVIKWHQTYIGLHGLHTLGVTSLCCVQIPQHTAANLLHLWMERQSFIVFLFIYFIQPLFHQENQIEIKNIFCKRILAALVFSNLYQLNTTEKPTRYGRWNTLSF